MNKKNECCENCRKTRVEENVFLSVQMRKHENYTCDTIDGLNLTAITNFEERLNLKKKAHAVT